MAWWDTLGKIGAYVASPFTGGASLLALPAIGAAKGALSDADGDGKKDGWKGAAKGAAIGGVQAAIPYGAGKVISKIPGMDKVGGKIISGMFGGGSAKSVVPSTGGPAFEGPIDQPGWFPGFEGPINQIPDTGSSGLGPGGSFLTRAGDAIKGLFGDNASQRMADATSTLGGIADSEALNRYKKGEMTQGYDQLMLQAQQDRRAQETDAIKKLAQAGYLASGGAKPPLSQISLGGQMRALPDFGFGPRPASDAQRQGATTLQAEMLKRLLPEGSYTPTQPDYLNRGKLENVGQWGGVGAGIGGTILNLLGLGGNPSGNSSPQPKPSLSNRVGLPPEVMN